MAIRNKMVAEGLDPNLLEWVGRVICVPSVEHFTKISNSFFLLLLTEHQMHPCLTEGSGAPRIKMSRAPAPTASRRSVTEARFPSPRSFLQMWAGLRKEKDVPWRGWQNKCLKQESKPRVISELKHWSFPLGYFLNVGCSRFDFQYCRCIETKIHLLGYFFQGNVSNKSLILNKTLLTIYSQIIAGFCVRGTETTVKYLLSLPFALFNLDRKWITVDLGTLLCFYSQLNVIF